MPTNNSRIDQETSRIYSFYIISRARRVPLGASAPVSGILSDTVSRETILASERASERVRTTVTRRTTRSSLYERVSTRVL